MILLSLTPDDFTRQGRASRVNFPRQYSICIAISTRGTCTYRTPKYKCRTSFPLIGLFPGLLNVGDVIKEVNGQPVKNNPEKVQKILVCNILYLGAGN